MCAFDLNKKELDCFVYEGIQKPRVAKCLEYMNKIIPKNNMKDFAELKQNQGVQYYVFNKFGIDMHPTISMHHDWVKENLSEYYNPNMKILSDKWETLINKDIKSTIENFPFVGVLNYKTFTSS